MGNPVAYVIHGICRDGDPAYYSPAMFVKETMREGWRVWPLYEAPTPGCSAEVEVYYGWCFCQPKYDYGDRYKNDPDFLALYQGTEITFYDAPQQIQ